MSTDVLCDCIIDGEAKEVLQEAMLGRWPASLIVQPPVGL